MFANSSLKSLGKSFHTGNLLYTPNTVGRCRKTLIANVSVLCQFSCCTLYLTCRSLTRGLFCIQHRNSEFYFWFYVLFPWLASVSCTDLSCNLSTLSETQVEFFLFFLPLKFFFVCFFFNGLIESSCFRLSDARFMFTFGTVSPVLLVDLLSGPPPQFSVCGHVCIDETNKLQGLLWTAAYR